MNWIHSDAPGTLHSWEPPNRSADEHEHESFKHSADEPTESSSKK